MGDAVDNGQDFADIEHLDYLEGLDIVVAAAFLEDGKSSAWFPEQRVIFVDHRVDPREKWAALVHELMAALTVEERDVLDLWLAPGLDALRTA